MRSFPMACDVKLKLLQRPLSNKMNPFEFHDFERRCGLYLHGLLILDGWTLMYGETGLSTKEPKPRCKSDECSLIL